MELMMIVMEKLICLMRTAGNAPLALVVIQSPTLTSHRITLAISLRPNISAKTVRVAEKMFIGKTSVNTVLASASSAVRASNGNFRIFMTNVLPMKNALTEPRAVKPADNSSITTSEK
jgi:hypothetical protein